MMRATARRVVLATENATAIRSSSRHQVRAKSTLIGVQRSLGGVRHLASGPARGFLTRQAKAVPIVQAIELDRFGRQHRIEVKVNPSPQSDKDDVLCMAKWAAGLLASGACMASAMSESGQAHAAASSSSSGSKNNDQEDLLEQLKKRVQEFAEEGLAGLQGLLPSHLEGAQKQIKDFLASGKGGQISWGLMMGVCSGFALKKVSKLGAIALGSVFIMFQCASYAGYIDVNHKQIEKDVMGVLDINKDGQFDAKDIDQVYQQIMKVLEYSMPAGSGFAVGFLVGFRAG